LSQLQVETGPAAHAEFERDQENYQSLKKILVHFKRKKEFQSAKKVLEKMLALSPNFADFLDLARHEFEDQCYTACLQAVDQALSCRGTQLKGLQEVYRLQGASLIHLGQLERAEDSLFKALEYPGENDVVLVNLGTLDIQRKSWEQATISFREALKVNSSNDRAWVGLALCHRFRGDHALAFGNLELALDLAPRNETALGLMLAWYGDTKETSIRERLTGYLVAGGENENLWMAFIESSFKCGETFVARMELERLRLTKPDFLPAYQLRA